LIFNRYSVNCLNNIADPIPILHFRRLKLQAFLQQSQLAYRPYQFSIRMV